MKSASHSVFVLLIISKNVFITSFFPPAFSAGYLSTDLSYLLAFLDGLSRVRVREQASGQQQQQQHIMLYSLTRTYVRADDLTKQKKVLAS